MYSFIDLHCHILCNVDDGAKDTDTMKKMLDIAYSDGTKTICFTPHFKVYKFDSDEEILQYNKAINHYFKIAEEYAQSKYPDMNLYLGNEIMFHTDISDSLATKKCSTLSDSSFVLIEFPPHISSYDLRTATLKLLRKGFTPVLAHVERYEAFVKDFSLLEDLKDAGAIIQVNASSITDLRFGKTARFLQKALKNKLVDIVCSDSHDAKILSPVLSKAHKRVLKAYGEDYAKKIFHDNQLLILPNTTKETENELK